MEPAKRIETDDLSTPQGPAVSHSHYEWLEKRLDPLNDGISSLALIRVSGTDLDVVNAARVSYGKIAKEVSERDKKLIKYLMEHQHTSPFEHNQLSFRVKAPLYVARQWMRHRMNSYNEISYRYVKAPVEFYIPSHWRHQDASNKQLSMGAFDDQELRDQYRAAVKHSFDAYQQALDAGVCRELARGLLPMCTYTEFIYTCNLQSLMHFLKLRLGPGAQYEIKHYAEGLLHLAMPFFPISLSEWQRLYAPFVDLPGLETVLGD